MSHALHRVVSFRRLGEYRLLVQFEGGISREIDFLPVLKGEIFGPLVAPEVFAGVRLDHEAHTLVWPNGADFDPVTLYDWPRCGPALAKRAEGWATPASVHL